MHPSANPSPALPWYHRLSLRSKFVLIFYLVTLTFLAVIGHYGYYSAAEAFRGRAMERIQGQIQRVGDQMGDKLQLSRSALQFFANHYSLKHMLYWQDMEDGKRQEQWRAVTHNEWLGYLQSAEIYHRVSFIGRDGRERLAVRRDPSSQEVQMVDESQLQEWSSDAIVQAVLSEEGNGYMVSRLELNREQGVIRKPFVPVLRLIQPVLGDNQVKYGVVMVTLFADTLLETLREANRGGGVSEYYLLDANGFYLFHTLPEKRFGHLLGHAENVGNPYPGIMQRLQFHPEGTFVEQGQIIGHKRIFPQAGDVHRYWTILSVTPEKAVLADLEHFRLLFFTLVFVLLAVVFWVVRRYIDSLMGPLSQVTRHLQSLGRGEVAAVTIAYGPQDEIRWMLDSLERLTGSLEQLVTHADAIARGDMTRQVPLLSEQDRLGLALNRMTGILRSSRQTGQQQLWLKDGISQLNQVLSSGLPPAELAQRALQWIARYLAAGRGAVYLFEVQQGRLRWLAGYMFAPQREEERCIALGQGAVGQVALEHKPVLLRWTDPDPLPELQTATERRNARYTFGWPLLREGELLGVMELNSLLPLEALHQEFLEGATQVTANFLYIALQRERIENLLHVAEEARHDALQQTVRLERANAQMEEQQQQLQQQTEELQQSNTHMEEQQQMLQQQALILQSQNEELQRSQEELDLRAGMLEESNRYKSEFLANISHELRTPLNSIIVLARMLMSNEQAELAETSQHQAKVIHEAGNELLRLINDILDLSKVESGRMELLREWVESQELLEEWQGLFAAMAREKGIVLRLEDGWRGGLYTDRHKLSQIVRNLLANAIKFTQQGQVSLLVSAMDDRAGWVRFVVRDSGIGIAPEQQGRIFEAFQQVDGSISRQYGGTGLGLSICRHLVQLLDGEVTVDSVLGQGSTFTVELPVYIATGQSQPLTGADQPLLAQRTILVVDDDPRNLFVTTAALEQQGGTVLQAINGHKALEWLAQEQVHLVLMDVMMPEMSGYETIEAIRKQPRFHSLPIIALTAKAMPEERDQCLQAGANDYLAKPVDDEMLRSLHRDGVLLLGERGGIQHVEGERCFKPLQKGSNLYSRRAWMVDDHEG
ncbi:MAG: response regulator [Magnetococcales bacterium]|nr:response regulator [Magnetococcales bacterium]MBF0113451.1 response regulator [Magnetococcales bacterium]